MIIDLAKYKTKKELLNCFTEGFEEMYSANYDALYDVLTEIDIPFKLVFVNLESYEQPKFLKRLLEDAKEANDNLTITFE